MTLLPSLGVGVLPDVHDIEPVHGFKTHDMQLVASAVPWKWLACPCRAAMTASQPAAWLLRTGGMQIHSSSALRSMSASSSGRSISVTAARCTCANSVPNEEDVLESTRRAR